MLDPLKQSLFIQGKVKYYLASQFTLDEKTLFKGVKQVLPAHTLTLKNGNIQLKKYWEVRYSLDWHHTKQYFQEKVRNRDYVMTYHARKEMNEDQLTIYDVEQGILSGEIVERQKDRETGEWKYRINGETVSGEEIEVITKLSITGKLVIITVYIV